MTIKVDAIISEGSIAGTDNVTRKESSFQQHIQYQPAIDGLRAVSVIGVMLFHLDRELLPGGFTGVDVFFVISGYLITSIILLDCKNERFTFAKFYQRRISRIFPHSFFVAAITLACSLWVYSPEDIGMNAMAFSAAAVSAANLKFAMQGSYFGFQEDTMPLLHYWSLAIEEQFYLVLPLLIVFVFRYFKRISVIQVCMILLGFVSLVACIGLTHSQPRWSFFLLPTRMWELLAGCLLATLLLGNSTSERVRRGIFPTACQFVGIGFIFVSFCFLDGENGFPGWKATLPVVGALLLICGIVRSESIVKAILSKPALVWIGKVSFALYLWHWPVFCFVDYTLFVQSIWVRVSIKVIATACLAFAGFYWIETPSRHFLNNPQTQRLAYVLFFVFSLAFFGVGIGIRLEYFTHVSVPVPQMRTGGLSTGDTSSPDDIVVIGDSHAGMYGKLFIQYAEELKCQTHILAKHSSDPFPNSEHWKSSLEYINKEHPKVVVFVASWGPKLKQTKKLLPEALDKLLEVSNYVVLITQPPRMPTSATRAEIRRHGLHTMKEEDEIRKRRIDSNQFLKSLASEKVIVVDIEENFVDNNGNLQIVDEHGRQLYRDDNHLSYYGGLRVKRQLTPILRKLLNPVTTKVE